MVKELLTPSLSHFAVIEVILSLKGAKTIAKTWREYKRQRFLREQFSSQTVLFTATKILWVQVCYTKKDCRQHRPQPRRPLQRAPAWTRESTGGPSDLQRGVPRSTSYVRPRLSKTMLLRRWSSASLAMTFFHKAKFALCICLSCPLTLSWMSLGIQLLWVSANDQKASIRFVFQSTCNLYRWI